MSRQDNQDGLVLLLLLALLGGGAAWLLLRKPDQSTPGGTVNVKVAGQDIGTANYPPVWDERMPSGPPAPDAPRPDTVKARAYGPAIPSVWKDGPRYSCPIGAHVEYASDGSAWCVLNTPASQQRHTVTVGTATVTVPTFLNPLADLWNIITNKPTPAIPPVEQRRP